MQRMTPVWLLCQHVYRFVDRVPHNDVGSMLEEDSLIVAEPIIVEQKELSPLTVRNALSRCVNPLRSGISGQYALYIISGPPR